MTDKEIKEVIEIMNDAVNVDDLRINFINYEKNSQVGISIKEIIDILNYQQAENEEMITHIECLKKECDEWHKTAELNEKGISKLRTLLEESRNQCAKFNELTEKALNLCDDKDTTINGLFETIKDWEKAYEGARYLAYKEFADEIKLIPGLITRKKIGKLLREKGW